MKPGDLEDRLINFAVRVVNVVEALPASKAANHIAKQNLFGQGRLPLRSTVKLKLLNHDGILSTK